MKTSLSVVAATIVLCGVTGCAAAVPERATQGSATPGSATTRAAAPAPSPTSSAPSSPPSSAPDQDVVGTIVRFTADRTSVDVVIGEDSVAVRDFLALLPLELSVEDFAGAEKIAYLPRELEIGDTAGSDPEDGDLIYYTPWGNLGFYYDASGVGYSDATLHLGTFSATVEQLSLLEGGPVIVHVAD